MASSSNSLHIAMYPWFAMSHITQYLHVSNKLAKKGHRITFIIPEKTIPKLLHFNHNTDLIKFVPIKVPHVDGLPLGSETTADVPYPLHTLIMTAMDLTQPELEHFLKEKKPNIIFFDFTHWIPKMASRLGIKSIHFCIISAATIGYTLTPSRQICQQRDSILTEADLMNPPSGYPSSDIKLHIHEAKAFASKRSSKFGGDTLFYERQFISFSECDAIGFRTCEEIEGDFVNYLGNEFKKPILLSGSATPDPPTTSLDQRLKNWLSGFKVGSVVYCAFGSECTMKKDQFQELLLGLELSNFPFFAALKPPFGAETVEEAMDEGFVKRIEGRGVVHGEWVQQHHILEHPSVGCFVTHCGSGSLSEALVNKCQLVLLPQVGDQIINARMMSRHLKVGVEVEKDEEDGLFTMETVCKALKIVMDKDNEIGKEIRENHAKIREFLLSKNLEESYNDSFINSLHNLVA